MFKFVNLILLVPTTNVGSERLRSTLCRVETYLWSSMTQEYVSSCLIVTTYKKQVDKLKLVEAASTPCPSAPVAIQLCTRDQNYIQRFQQGNMKKN